VRTERESNAPRSASPAATAAPGEALWPVPSGSEPPATFETELPLLTAHEELLLAQQVEAGDPHAREELITRNLRLVAHIARGYAGYARGALGLDDLIQEGRIGLIKAVDRFDPRRGCRFSTYATHWINQAITRAVETQSLTVRIPAHAGQMVRRATRCYQELVHELGREPSDAELARALGTSTAPIAAIAAIARPALSLDAPLSPDEDSGVLGDLLEDTRGPSTDEAALLRLLRRQLDEALAGLTAREREIVSRRYGLEGGMAETLSEIGTALCMSRERVRQIEQRALRKLRLALAALVLD
jgi:RNA polymerase primary sigma factor